MNESKRRFWTSEEDERLTKVMSEMESIKFPGRVSIWSAICGRLAPEVVVTPDSAKARWRRLERQAEAAAAASAEALRLEEERQNQVVEAEWWETQDPPPAAMGCGHPELDLVSSDEGTHYCAGCERDAQEAQAGGWLERIAVALERIDSRMEQLERRAVALLEAWK